MSYHGYLLESLKSVPAFKGVVVIVYHVEQKSLAQHALIFHQQGLREWYISKMLDGNLNL